jgi:hypothetical protein
MLPQPQDANRRPNCCARLTLGLAALGVMLAASGARSQSQQDTTPVPQTRRPTTPTPTPNRPQYPQTAAPVPQAQRPTTPTPTPNRPQYQQNTTPVPQTQRPTATTPTPHAQAQAQAQAPSLRQQQLPVNGANNSSTTTNSSQSRTPGNPTSNSAQKRALSNTVTPSNNTRNSTNGVHLANLNPSQASSAPLVPSRTFLGHPGPPGSRETQTRTGNIVRTAADGSVMDVRNPRNGMSIHHGLDGSRRIMVDRPDRSRIVAASSGVQYVQHPYSVRGRPFDHRTIYVQGKVLHQFYRPYSYAGTTLDVYAPARFYGPDFYQWATSRFDAPARYNWPYTTTATPWFGYYKGYFTPDSSYASPESWLTDYVLASSLSRAYATEPQKTQAPPAGASAAVTPQVKQMLAEEVGRQVRQESAEAKENAQNKDPRPGAGSVVEELGDHQPHVFVVASDLDLVDPTGRRCMISEGDVVQVVSGPKSSTSTAEAVVLASKGGVECERAAKVEIALNDLQEMQNHMRETIDQGMANTDRGKKAATVTPDFAASAPPPDPNAAREIDQQQQIAAAAEG